MSRTHRRAIGGAALGLLAALLVAGAPSARAAPPWSDPHAVVAGHLLSLEPVTAGSITALRLDEHPGLLGFTPGGAGLAVLGRAGAGSGIIRFNGATGTFSRLRPSPLGGVAPTHMATYGREALVLAGGADDAGDRRAPGAPDILLDAAVTRGSVRGTFARRQVLARGLTTGGPAPALVTALAANAAGHAAVVVTVPVRGRTRVVGYQARLFIRRPADPAFRRIADIGVRTVGRSPAALAVNPSGDVLVAWDDRKSVRARVVLASGRIGREQRLGRGGSAYVGGGRMAASIDAGRRMLVAWMAQRVGEGNYAGSPGTVTLSYASPGKGFGPEQVVQRDLPKGPDRGIRGPAVQAALLRDRGVVAWTGHVGGRYAARTVDVRDGRAGTPEELSPPGTDARLQGLAAGPRGGTVVTWASDGPATAVPPPGLYAKARAAGTTAWGPLETVGPTGFGGNPAPSPLATDPVSGRAVTLWSDPVATVPVPVAGPVTARYAVRSAAG